MVLPAFDSIAGHFDRFCKGERGPMSAFWMSYLEMVSLLLCFVRATRSGYWDLHLQCVRSMIPWYFAHDHGNYSRYLPVYYRDMMMLSSDNHPEASRILRDGLFAVQRSSNRFSQVAVDMTIEQTLNRDSKTKGGIVGMSLKPGAVYRWIVTAHDRASTTRACLKLAGIDEVSHQKQSIKSI